MKNYKINVAEDKAINDRKLETQDLCVKLLVV